MTSLSRLIIASGATLLALPSIAFAQESERYFDGPYISGAVGTERAADSRSDAFAFDIDRDGQFDDTVSTDTGLASFEPGFCSGAATSTTRTCRKNRSDEGYAVRIGYDRHLGDGPIVAGLLVEGARLNVAEITSGYTIAPEFYSISREIDWAVTGRARLGIAPGDGRGLFYVTGGAGFARIRSGFDTSNAINVFTPSNEKGWEFGWQGGGGAEIMLTRNVGIGLEYLYSNYDGKDYAVRAAQGTAADNNPFLLPAGQSDFRLSNDRMDFHAFRATASLRF
jgi:outer membrane immunogenic protein